MNRRLLVLLATVGISAAAGLSDARASTETLVDPHGDAPPSADVYSYKIANGDRSLRVAVHVDNLARHSDITLYANQAGPGEYVIRTSPAGKGTFTFERGTSRHEVHCQWSLRRRTGYRSTLTVDVPQRCFGSRAGDAWVDLIMWESGGQGSDDVARAFVPRG